MDIDAAWKTEEGFWLRGPEFYRDHMAPDAQMVFPDPVGILKGEAIVDALEEAPRWEAVRMDEKTTVLAGDALALAYRATGRRGEAAPYVALCSSTYVRRGGGWTMISHQQTPAG